MGLLQTALLPKTGWGRTRPPCWSGLIDLLREFFTNKRNKMNKKTVLITGCSSGFGKLAVQTFLENNWNVIATMRAPETQTEMVTSGSLLACKLDVTDDESIARAVAEGIATFGGIDVLVNNAGYGGHAMFEQFDLEHVQRMFDTNVYGPMRTAKAVLPQMRSQGAGAIINVTSMAGLIGLPFASTYSASKFAVEGWSEGLALEYAPFNVKVHTVAPGAYGTNFNAATDNSFETGDEQLCTQAFKMAKHFEVLAAGMRQYSGSEADPQEVADMIFACATKEMPVHNISGADAEMLQKMKDSQNSEEFLKELSKMLIPA